MDGDDPVVDPWWCPGDAADGDGSSVNMFQGHDSTDDLFELLRQVGGGSGGGGATAGQPFVSCLQASPPPPPPLPSEDVMAAWLYPIVSGQDLDGEHPVAVAKEASETSMMEAEMSKGKLPAPDNGTSGAKDTNTKSDSGEKKKASGGSSGRKAASRQSATHKITEKRRRCKITERLRTLQQLVPGCDKSNQASTLDQTIQYMKSLQQQVQAMNTCPAPPAALYPFPMPMPPTVAAVASPQTVISPPGMVPMVMMPAAPRCPPAAAPPPDATGDHHAQRSVSLEQQQQQQQHRNEKKGR